MSDQTSIQLTPVPLALFSREFGELSAWQFADPFVTRLLREDIPQRVQFNNCRIWLYLDPNRTTVGFGTLDVCDDYQQFTEGKSHPYIPLLAVNPPCEGRGHGKSILRHLIAEATLLACRVGGCHDVLLLDVYTTSLPAIGLYTKYGFTPLTDAPIPDPHEGGKPYIVMARRVSVEPAMVPALGSG